MNSDRTWTYRRPSGGYLNPEFIKGVGEFIEYATSQIECMGGDRLKCPCIRKSCQNTIFLPINDVKLHLHRRGFVPNYHTWYLHGEKEDDVVESSGNHLDGTNDDVYDNVFEHGGRFRDMIIDALHQQGAFNEDEDMEEEPNINIKKLYDMLEA